MDGSFGFTKLRHVTGVSVAPLPFDLDRFTRPDEAQERPRQSAANTKDVIAQKVIDALTRALANGDGWLTQRDIYDATELTDEELRSVLPSLNRARKGEKAPRVKTAQGSVGGAMQNLIALKHAGPMPDKYLNRTQRARVACGAYLDSLPKGDPVTAGDVYAAIGTKDLTRDVIGAALTSMFKGNTIARLVRKKRGSALYLSINSAKAAKEPCEMQKQRAKVAKAPAGGYTDGKRNA
jgi:hypothetical protein